MRFPMVLKWTGGQKRKWRGERKESSEIKTSGKHAFSNGCGMGRWTKRKWRGERKENSEIKTSGKHAFSYCFEMER